MKSVVGCQCEHYPAANMSDSDLGSSVRRRYTDLSLDLNLDQVTADEAWNNYENIQLKYTLEVRFALVPLHLLASGIAAPRRWRAGEKRPSSSACVRGTSPGAGLVLERAEAASSFENILRLRHVSRLPAPRTLGFSPIYLLPIFECLFCFRAPRVLKNPISGGCQSDVKCGRGRWDEGMWRPCRGCDLLFLFLFGRVLLLHGSSGTLSREHCQL